MDRIGARVLHQQTAVAPLDENDDIPHGRDRIPSEHPANRSPNFALANVDDLRSVIFFIAHISPGSCSEVNPSRSAFSALFSEP